MEITAQILLDAIEGSLSGPEQSGVMERLCVLSSSEVLRVARQAGINITGDGNIIGNNNVNIVVKDDLARILRDAFEGSRARYQLRAPVGDFVGRQSEVEQLKTALRAHGNAAISGISGMGGIGKTELGLYAAHQLRDDFPDGQLMVNMHGTDAAPRELKEALTECVRALVGLDRKLPDGVDELGNLYRSVLSDKRVLLFFDNLANGAQVSPLRPPSGCGMLITSRSPIVLPGIHNIHLGELDPTEARELLSRIAGDIDAAVANSICELCGFLPLAIRAAGSLLAVTPDLDPADFANQLCDERTRLEKLGTEGVDISVRASFNLSYAALPPEAAGVFRQTAVFPSSFTSAAEDFVCNDEDHKHLSDLVRRSLVVFDKENGRYRLHELMRIYARSLVALDERRIAEFRFSHYYARLLEHIQQLYVQSGGGHSKALRLFALEGDSIRAGWALSSELAETNNQAAQICLKYPLLGYYILLNRLDIAELKSWCQRSLVLSEELHNPAAELPIRVLLGLAYESIGEYSAAEGCFRRGVSLASERRDEHEIAIAREHLGRILIDTGRAYEGIQELEEAKQLLCGLGLHDKEGKVISDIALAYSQLKDTTRALQHLQAVLGVAREEGKKLDEANALGNLASVYGKSSDKEEALRCAESAAEIFEELGYQHWQAQAILQCGNLSIKLGKTERGIEQINRALAIYRDIGDRHGEVCAVGALGEAYMSSNPHEAIRKFDEQFSIAREIGDRHREGNALGDKAIVLLQLGEIGSAIALLEEAVTTAQETRNHDHEFISLCHLGKAYLRAGRRDDSIRTFEHHVVVAERMGVFRNKAHAIQHLVDLYKASGDTAKAVELMKKCVDESQTSRDPHDYPESVFQLANLFAEIGNHEEAIKQAGIATGLFESLSDASCVGRARAQIQDWRVSLS